MNYRTLNFFDKGIKTKIDTTPTIEPANTSSRKC